MKRNKLQTMSLGSIVRPRREKEKPADHPDLSFIGLEHIESHTTKLLGSVPATEMRSTAHCFRPGDVLFSRLRPYLNKVWRADRKGLCSSEFIVLPENNLVDGDFLRYRLSSPDFVAFASHLNTGDRPRVDFDQISVFQIFLPKTLEEQRRIVAEIEKQFTRLEAGVAALKRVQANLKRYRATVLKAACEGRLVPTEADLARKVGRSYETGDQLLARILTERRRNWQGRGKYKEPAAPDTANLSSLPEGWTWTGFEQLSDGTRHAIKAGPFGSALKKSFYVATGFKIYGQEQVINGDPYFGDYFISPELFNELKNCAVKPGDILISLVGTAGKVLILPEDCAPGIINPRLLKLSLNRTGVLTTFVKILMESSQTRAFFKLAAHGGTMEILNLSILKSLPIPLPPLAEQERIVAEVERRLSVVEELEKVVSANHQRAARLRQSILQRAFTGKQLYNGLERKQHYDDDEKEKGAHHDHPNHQ